MNVPSYHHHGESTGRHHDSHDIAMTDLKADDKKGEFVDVEHYDTTESKSGPPQMRSKADDLTVWQSVKRYKLVSLVAMCAAFSASLDGYQITLNSGIVSNKGFIRQFAAPGTTIIKGKYVSAWGGIQSAGQTIGQIASLLCKGFTARFLQYATEAFGRKVAFCVFFVVSIFVESIATRWDHWLVAKLFSGAVWPCCLLINAYSFWFVIGQLCGAISLNRLNAIDPYDFRTPIYTRWAMIGAMIIIFLLIPETPWWLAGKEKLDKVAKVLLKYNGHIEGYNVQETIDVMTATKITQQFVGRAFSIPTRPISVFFACLATFSITGVSAIGYAYAAEVPQQRPRAQTVGWALALSNLIAKMFSFCTPLMINGSLTKWDVKTGFFFACTGAIAVIVAWFTLPEVARRTPGEIRCSFEKKANPRKFKKYVTDVQIHADAQHKKEELKVGRWCEQNVRRKSQNSHPKIMVSPSNQILVARNSTDTATNNDIVYLPAQ
ncbi:uncharacterized protein Z518_03328 [Rhinocladiella mackenziei CBS 650.93]|uniref:Rhinocladiella mackenziei CBS 650.93 unplaced genomic scaffold supercont1.2, whole genome shotgun sequence n=1 Tax=Rhinocladiella mackenziei CBS 650.93 TaxID=1442369 RepID=A0A0D2IZ43_9EURO|nr:uncharacterized protein Z518_03328 [Rhinocladiella mackenziei CBS 650.93]KIX08671.1 hypothetical protein Z518_03328 [Rhinocladiella mackenziei CBS 650.93]